MSTILSLQSKADELGPWRYSYEYGGVRIQGDPVAAPIHGAYGRGKETMEHIVNKLHSGERSHMRALDLGCLEGHYTELLCRAGFQEVVAVDLSSEQVARAHFLLKTLMQFTNVTVLQGSVEDRAFMESLGTFDVILFHGLLYHLKDPIGIFETLSQVSNPRHILLLSTQFKFPFSEIIAPSPIANIKFRGSTLQAAGQGGLVKYEGTHSTYARMATRLNPAALNRLLRKLGFSTLVAYDTPLGCAYGFQVHLVASMQPLPGLVGTLNQGHNISGLQFFPWQGDRLDGFSLRGGWRNFVSRFALRVAYSLGERLGGSAARQARRIDIAHHAE
jgi:2-polyprenyl-3-methyl-5-hydroxy-6-metoxy-1,4-benzoquinol methylase